MRNAPPHTPLYVLAMQQQQCQAKHYILLGCLAKVTGKLSNWSGFPPVFVTCFPSSREQEQCLENVTNMTKECSRDDAQCTTTHHCMYQLCSSSSAKQSTTYCLAALPRWLESFQIGLVSPSIRYLFSQFSKKSRIRQKKVVVTMHNAPPHTTVCTSTVQQQQQCQALHTDLLPCPCGWKAFKLDWFDPV